MSSFQHKIKSYSKQNIGFACFLAWNYISLYGCGIAAGGYIRCALEHFWLVAGLAEALIAGVCLLLVTKRGISVSKTWGIAAAASAVLGNVGIWVSYFNTDLFWPGFIIGGALCGLGVALMTVVWGQRLTSKNEAKIEFDVLASFVIAFALYCLTIPIKLWGVADLLIASALALASMVLAFRQSEEPALSTADEKSTSAAVSASAVAPAAASAVASATAQEKPTPCRLSGATARSELRESISIFLVIALLWFQIAFFRVLATPPEPGDRYTHFLIPFSIAFAVTIILFALLLRGSRYLNFTLIFRWALPFLLLELGLLYSNYDNFTVRIAAFTVNYIGMFGMQISYWIAMPKYLRRSKGSVPLLFLGLALSEGAGIFLGALTGLTLTNIFGDTMLPNVSIFTMVGVTGIALLAGFNPSWMFNRAARSESAQSDTAPCVLPNNFSDPLDSLFHQEAAQFANVYGLTERETEVAALLLAGRNRPYIRDELIISLNTVHAHARNIFAKCDVHSQQEFIDLARKGTTAHARSTRSVA